MNPLSRRYSCAFRSSRNSRHRRRLRSARAASAGRRRCRTSRARAGRLAFAATASTARSRGSPYSSRPASRWKRMVSSDGQSEMPQLDLAVRAGERERPRDGAAIVILVDQPRAPPSLSAIPGREREPRRATGREPHRLTQADDRIEHRPGRVRQRPSASSRPADRASGLGPRSGARSVSYSVAPPGRRGRSARGPVPPFAAGRAAAWRRSAHHVRGRRGLDEQIAERRWARSASAGASTTSA